MAWIACYSMCRMHQHLSLTVWECEWESESDSDGFLPHSFNLFKFSCKMKQSLEYYCTLSQFLYDYDIIPVLALLPSLLSSHRYMMEDMQIQLDKSESNYLFLCLIWFPCTITMDFVDLCEDTWTPSGDALLQRIFRGFLLLIKAKEMFYSARLLMCNEQTFRILNNDWLVGWHCYSTT